VLPQPVEAYTTGKVLTMTLFFGRKISDITPIGRIEFDGTLLAHEFMGAYQPGLYCAQRFG